VLPLKLYDLLLRGAEGLLPAAARSAGKLGAGARGRRGAVEAAEAWARAGRDPARPLVWLHAPSVGEGLQARAVIEELRRRRPDLQLAYTCFSPSAESLASSLPVDWWGYLPLDTRRNADRMLAALRPAVIAFNKSEAWPTLTAAAARSGVRTALLSATLPAGAGRLRFPAPLFLTPTFGRLDAVGAIHRDDALRFRRLGVSPERLEVTGDARMDQVLARAAAVDRGSALMVSLRAAAPVLVAGSTWPEDEERLLEAAAGALESGSLGRLVVVPHEPTAEHLAGLTARLRGAGLPSTLLSAGGDPAPVLVVDRVGILGELYGAADVAYVGGGFGKRGIHSVLEPAAFGVPVLFGPRHANAREAAELVEAGGAFEAGRGAALRWRLEALLIRPETRTIAGAAARAYVEARAGGAARGAELVLRLLERGAPEPPEG
jgi:3-deoxy-D-manno-octulosonic-acid transferase